MAVISAGSWPGWSDVAVMVDEDAMREAGKSRHFPDRGGCLSNEAPARCRTKVTMRPTFNAYVAGVATCDDQGGRRRLSAQNVARVTRRFELCTRSSRCRSGAWCLPPSAFL